MISSNFLTPVVSKYRLKRHILSTSNIVLKRDVNWLPCNHRHNLFSNITVMVYRGVVLERFLGMLITRVMKLATFVVQFAMIILP